MFTRSSVIDLRLAVVGVVSALSLVTGLIPAVNASHAHLEFGSVAQAQQSTSPISQYAHAAYEIEQIRQRDYAEAKRIMGGNVPGDVCRQADIPQQVRDICGRFLNNSTEIIKKYGLTVSQFNDLTRRKESDPNLQQQIQSELLRLQKSTP